MRNEILSLMWDKIYATSRSLFHFFFSAKKISRFVKENLVHEIREFVLEMVGRRVKLQFYPCSSPLRGGKPFLVLVTSTFHGLSSTGSRGFNSHL